ncbi:penicillin-binding protein 1A [Pseudaeromonas sharmana]|uniref:Penicillin-binding protein 1A n=1 Tax=Pseudaeromonas sharmana TaxID=328412 RepID=A0ABV8CRL6_9GAMM
MLIWLKRLFWFGLFLVALGIAGISAFYFALENSLPDVTSLRDAKFETPMRVYSADGALIAEYGEMRRIPLKINEIPQPMIDAFLSIEDARFYEHPGIDPIGIMRAGVVWLTTGQMRQGASTITQQVARNFFLSREKTILRKIKEVFLAWHIEKELSKDEILELYLNKIPLGYRAFGVGAAAQVYYGKPVDQLTLGQIAVIAGLPKAPSMLNPIRSPQRAEARRNVVLGRMLELGKITREQYDAAKMEPVATRYHGADIMLNAAYVGEMARKFMVDRYGDEAYTKGFNVYTTITAKLQKAADDAVFRGLLDYDLRHGYRGAEKRLWQAKEPAWTTDRIYEYLNDLSSSDPFEPAVVTRIRDKQADVVIKGGLEGSINWDGMKWARPFITDERQGTAPRRAADILHVGDLIWVWPEDDTSLRLVQIPEVNAAFVALDPQNGAIQALVGGFSFEQSKFNRVDQAKRQAGSNIKPFIYSAAFNSGFTLASLVNDAPINQWDTASGTAWSPKNSPPVYDGPITLREALARSKNVVSVRLLRSVGIGKLMDHLRQFGFDVKPEQRNEALALGAIEVSPMEMATGYAAIANSGYKVTPHIITKVEDTNGTTLFEAKAPVACPSCSNTVTPDPATASALPAAPADPTAAPLAPQIISHANAFLVSEAMHSAIFGGKDRGMQGSWLGTGWRAARELKRQDIAGKTGTTNEAKDAWFSGFNSKLVATTWVGFDDHRRKLGRSIAGNEYGASAAQPIWIEFMKIALANTPEAPVPRPDDVVEVRIDNVSGMLSTPEDSNSRVEYFQKGSEPTLANPGNDTLFGEGGSSEPGTSTDDIF